MITFRQFIAEVFDKPLEHRYNPPPKHDPHMHTYAIGEKSGRPQHLVIIQHVKHAGGRTMGHVDFVDHQGELGVTGKHKFRAHRVLGTVQHIVQKHAEEHKLDGVHFGSADADGGRTKVYSRMLNRTKLKSNVTHHGDMTDFVVATKK